MNEIKDSDSVCLQTFFFARYWVEVSGWMDGFREKSPQLGEIQPPDIIRPTAGLDPIPDILDSLAGLDPVPDILRSAAT